MGHTVIEKHHTPLDRAAAKKLVEIALVTDDEVGEALEDDVAIFIDKEKPPSAARARERKQKKRAMPNIRS